MLVIAPAKAQKYALRHYDANDGLPSSDVFHAIQDSKGYIWFATDNGVSRFNGYEFTNFDISDGLVRNTILEIFEDYKGRIWFVSIRADLCYYENGKIIQYKYNGLVEEELKLKPVPLKSSFYVDSSDNVFLGIEGFGIIRISDSGEVQKVAAKKENPKACRIIEKPNNKLLLSYYNRNIKDSALYVKDKVSIPMGLKNFPTSYLKHFYANKISDGETVISVGNVLYKTQNYIDIKRYELPFRIHWQSIDKDNNIWVCGAAYGAWRINSENIKTGPAIKLLNGYSVSSILQDSRNGVWFTTLHNGVYYLPSFKISYFDKSTGLLKNNINAIGKHGDSLWIGFHSNYINLLKGNGIKKIKLSNFKALEVTKIFYDTINEQTVIGTSKNLFFIKSGRIIERKNNYPGLDPKGLNPFIIKDIIPDKKGGYWICGGEGFYHWKDGHTVFDAKINKNFRLRSSTLFLDGNTLYIGTVNGLWKFKNNYLQYLARVNGLLKLRVLDIIKYKNEIIIGTKGGGLLIMHNDSVRQFTKKDGLSSNTITTMAVQKGYLWVGTKNGLNRISFVFKNKHTNLKVSRFTKAHGLPTNEIRFMQAIGNSLLIGTNLGLIKFDIESLKKDTLEIPLYYKKVMINNKTVPVQKSYDLGHDQNNLWVKFEGISFQNGNNLQYKYMMKGLDTEWNFTKNKEIRFSFLPPGKYELLISAMNRDQVWNTHPISMAFVIENPLWENGAFKLTGLFFIIILLYLIFRYSMQKIKKNASLEHERKKFVKQALINQMNPHFIFNALNSINNYILTNDKNKASKYLTKFSGLIRLFLENSEKEYISINEEINTCKLYLEVESKRLTNGLDYEFIVADDIDQFKAKVPSLFIQPFLENSVWHGIQPLTDKGKISVVILKKELSLQIIVEDNGIGRKEASKQNQDQIKKQSMGIEIIRKRMKNMEKLYGEKLSIEYKDVLEKGKVVGTQAIITIPFIN